MNQRKKIVYKKASFWPKLQFDTPFSCNSPYLAFFQIKLKYHVYTSNACIYLVIFCHIFLIICLLIFTLYQITILKHIDEVK